MSKRKLSVIVSAILVCMVCVSLIAGSTFALFTSQDKVNVAVTTAKVNVEATLANVATETEQNDLLNGANKVLGAEIVDGKLEVTDMLPGDVVNVNLVITNNSTVAIKYRVCLEIVGAEGLVESLIWSLNGRSYATNATSWADAAIDAEITLPVSVSLPAAVGNVAQGANCTIAFTVEAVQGNAAV